MSRRRRSDYRLSLGWILGVTFIGTLTRLKLPQWSSLSFGAAVCLRLPPHTTSQRKLSRLATDHATCSCLRLTVATNSPRKGLSPPIQCPCRAHHGFVDQALQTLARSDLVASHTELSFPKIIPDLEYAPIDESYVAAWFHGLAHEAGHHVKPNHRKLLESLPFLKDEEVRQLVSDLIVHFYPDADNQKTLKRIVNRANTTPGSSSFAATAQIQDEAIADITAASILLETATDVFSQLDREPPNRMQLFCEIMLQMNCLMIIQQCNVLASWFSSIGDELENQNLILSNIALQARQNLLIRACKNAHMSDHLPDFSTVVASDGFESLMMTLSANSRKIEEGVWRARAFLSSPDMRDIEVFYACVDKLPGDPAAAMAAKEFVRLADSMGRRSPELEMLTKAIGVELS